MTSATDWATTREILEKGKQGSWYEPAPDKIPEETRRLLEEYSHIAPDQVLPHLNEYVSTFF